METNFLNWLFKTRSLATIILLFSLALIEILSPLVISQVEENWGKVLIHFILLFASVGLWINHMLSYMTYLKIKK